MEALCAIDDIQLIRLIRRDERERLFVGTPCGSTWAAGVPSLVQLFELPAGAATAGHVERHLELVRAFITAAATGTPRVLGMGRKDPSSLFLVTEDPVGLPLARVLAGAPDWARHRGRAWLAALVGLLARLHGQDLASGRVLPRHLLVNSHGAPILAEPLTALLLHRIHGAISFQDPAFLRLHPDAGATPPEVLGGAAPAPPGDIFQAGVLLHSLWTGRAPFGEGSSLEVFNRVRSGRLVHPFPGDDPALAAAAAACLAPKPEDRPTAEELALILGSDAVDCLPPGDVVESRYSDSFTTLLQLHDGDGAGAEAATPPPRPPPTDTDRKQAIAQLDTWLAETSTRHRSGAGDRGILPWLLVIIAASAAGFLLWSFAFSGMEPAPSSRVIRKGGLTHAPSSKAASSPRAGARSWHLDGLPDELRAALDRLDIPSRNLPLTVRKVAADCEVVTTAPGSVRHRFVFPRCRDLSRVCTLGHDDTCAPGPDGTLEIRVLYDPDGRPLLLQALGPDDKVIRNIEIR